MISNELKNVVHVILIHYREVFQESLSPMKLQKLCYYAQGLYMANQNGKPLFNEDFEAWTYGPVIRELYRIFKAYGWRNIDEEFDFPTIIESDKEELIKDVVEAYGRYDGAALSTMTHREPPWLEARKGLPETEGSDAIIPKDRIKIFFEQMLASYQG